MKHLANRGLALLLALALCISMLPGISLTADAVSSTSDYVTSSAGYIYNWGKRGTTATYLSPNAEAFYADNNVTYAQLAALSGASELSDIPGSTLYQSLHELMESNHSYETKYADTKDLFQYTDCQENGTGSTGTSISSFYSGSSIGPSWDGTWNREHTWPDSKGQEGNDENDIMMLRPTASSENSSRGNTAYGESSGYYNPNSASGNTYDLRGDVARLMLGHYVRWEMYGYTYKEEDFSMFGTNGVMESKEVLLKWIEEDPVDTWELGRNDSVESITGYRNVFVDYPELAFVLFGEEIPADYTTPSGEASASAYNITAVSNNSSFGTVSLGGRTITAFPCTGYEVEGYTVTSGVATVTQNGNAFTVAAESDCTVQINFKARTAAYGNFYENGTACMTLNYYAGDIITLPAAVNEAPTGFTFQGWVTSTVDETNEQPTILTVGSAYTLDETTQFYALYSRVVADTTGTSNLFELYTGPVVEGDYILVFNYGAMQASLTDKNRFNILTGMTFADNNGSIVSPTEDIIWTMAAADGYYTLYNEAAAVYAAGTGASNVGGLITEVTDYAKWTVTVQTDDAGAVLGYKFMNLGNISAGCNPQLQRNSNFGFACYSENYTGPLTLYKRSTGIVLYSTTAVECSHENTEELTAVAPSCTEVGYTAGVRCLDCSNIIEGHTVVNPLSHSYESVVTEPTATEQGYTTHTCTNCGDSYVDSYTEALGENYTVSFVVPEGVAAIADMSCNKAGITLPEAESPDELYTFAGWATESVSKTETAPTLYNGEYIAEGNITLYAVYSYAVGGTGNWTLVTDTSQISVGSSVVIAALDFDYAMSTNQKDNNRAAVAVTKTNGILTVNDDVQVFYLEAGTSDGSYAFYTGSGYLYAASTSNNYLKIQTTLDANGSFTVDIASTGSATIKSVGNTSRGWLRYNNSRSDNLLFSCYSTGQKDICLYTMSGSSMYTSDPTICEHANTQDVAAVEPTCTEPGNSAGVYCNDCETYIEGYEFLSALGHKYESVVTDPTITEGGYTTYICSTCGDTYVSDYTDAIGETYTISFQVPNGVEAVASMGCANAGIKLPYAGVPASSDREYTFVGWTTVPTEDVSDKPEIMNGGSWFYNNGADQTLYAVYSYVVGGTGGDFTLVTDDSQLSAGTKVIIAAADYNYAISVTQNTNNRAQTAITKSGNIITEPSNTVAIFTLEEGSLDGTWAFWDDTYTSNGYLYAASSTSNYLRTGYLSDNSSWLITVNSDGSCNIVAKGSYTRNTMQYNQTSSLFACYASASQKKLALYAQAGGGTMYYTTEIDASMVTNKVGDGEGYYATLADAMADSAGDYLYLLADLTEDVYVDYDMILDLNGKTLTGDITIEEGASLKLFDSATADYTAQNRGKVVGTVTGNLVRAFNTPGAYGHNYKYLTVQEADGSYSAHRIYLTVKSASLVPYVKGEDSVGTAASYKTVFKCNDVVAQYVTAYGVKFVGDETVYANYMADGAYTLSAENLGTAWLANTLSTANSDEVNAVNGLLAPAVSAYITLNDGLAEEVSSASVSRSLQDLVVYANNQTELTNVEQIALGTMYKLFQAVMDAWADVDITNIKNYGAALA